MNKIFTNNKPLIFFNTQEELKTKVDFIFECSAIEKLKIKIESFEKDTDMKSMGVLLKNGITFQNIISALYKSIHAAGGIVRNKENDVLFIFRNGKWDLPKGKIEFDENEEQAAVREVQEECGIQDLSVSKKLCTTYHTYKLGSDEILKVSHWYIMDYKGLSLKLVPQIEEGISIACWKNEAQIIEALHNSYLSIAEAMSVYDQKY